MAAYTGSGPVPRIGLGGSNNETWHRTSAATLSLFDTPKAGYERLSGKTSWMLDSGASCHMVEDISVMSDLEKYLQWQCRCPMAHIRWPMNEARLI